MLRWLRMCAVAMLCAFALSAGPLDFGLSDVNAAFAERKLKWRVKTDLSMDPPESFRIEPYAYGGAHVTGGDLRGLMYGLLEAAEQMRVSGRMAKTQGKAAAALRGVRLVVTPEMESAPEEFWRGYFQRLARNRFNRSHVVVSHLQAPFALERRLSQITAEYAIDFTLGFENPVSAEDVTGLLAACPLIHSLAIDPDSPSTAAVMDVARSAGRRISVDLDGASTLEDTGVPILRPLASWPPSYEVATPFDPLHSDEHEAFFWMWGRFGYDPAVRLPKGADAAAYAAAREAILWTAAAGQAGAGGSEYVVSVQEAAAHSADAAVSAKFLPRDLADRLDTAVARIPANSGPDFTLIAEMARKRSAEIRADDRANALLPDSALSMSPNALAHPKATHIPPGNVPAGQSVTLRLQFAVPPAILKNLAPVRLHYRLLDPAAKEVVLESAAAPDVAFTIPGTELDGTWDVQYYFEILNKLGSGWFEPDPASGTPLLVVKIIPSRTGPN